MTIRSEEIAKEQHAAVDYTCEDAEFNERWTQEIHAALIEADAGDFASQDEVDAVQRNWS